MKAGIHPKYFPEAQLVCACGVTYTTGSTKERIDIEVCAACHPFFTGKQKIMDTARRVEKFTGRSAAKSETVLTSKDKAVKAAARSKAKADKKAAASS